MMALETVTRECGTFLQAMLTSEEEISAWLDFGEVPLTKVCLFILTAVTVKF